MTTQVKIIATSHDVEVFAADPPDVANAAGGMQLLHTVTKGTEWTTHIWETRALVVKEVPNA